MKYPAAVITVLVSFLISACASASVERSTLAPQTYHLDHNQVLQIEVNTGNVQIIGTQQDSLEVRGSLTNEPALVYKVEQSSTGLHILAQLPKRIFPLPAPDPIDLEIRIPAGYRVEFDTQEANLIVKDFRGDLQVSSVAGNVQVDGLNGSAVLKANRGEVLLQNSQGKLNLLGNYGFLSMLAVHGQINASTIMGSVSYNGMPQPGDTIHLETDHGPVQIILTDQPNLLVDIHSTSGEVVCMFTALERNPRQCRGTLGAGGGRLDVRTVSGNIIFQPAP
ncbi:MAG: DUF4097 family beta strand repeat-containing protein [Chloroflexi bacterium]|nr:DUF4097 family beta strand repeat-containing protein [Chloroflexota bacterium]